MSATPRTPAARITVRSTIAVAIAVAVAIGPQPSAPRAEAAGAARSGDLIIGFAPAATDHERRRALASRDLEVVRQVPHLDFVRVRPTSGATVSRAELLADHRVVSVDPVTTFRASAVPAPNDPNFRYQWNLPLVQIPDAWAVSRGAGATVAVLDTGVAYENFGHYRQAPDLGGTTFVPGYDFVDGDDHPNLSLIHI